MKGCDKSKPLELLKVIGEGLDTALHLPFLTAYFKAALIKVTRFKIISGYNKYFG